MASLRNHSAEHMTRSNGLASNISTRQNLNRRATSSAQQHRTSYTELYDDPDIEPDLNEAYIQSIEELLPEMEHVAEDLARIAQHRLLEEEPNTPCRPVKVERVSNTLPDIYGVSPHDHVHKAGHLERRPTSRSTAQLTTPASSPDYKCYNNCFTEKRLIVKSEVGQRSNGSHMDIDDSCTPQPDSISESTIPFKVLKRNGNPTTLHRSPSGRFQRNANSGDSCDGCGIFENHSRSITPAQRPNTQTNHGEKDALVSSQNSDVLISKYLASRENQGERSMTAYPQFFARAKERRLSSKTMTPPVHGRILSTPPSTPTGSIENLRVSSKNKTCCKLMCLECTPKDLQEEYGLGPPEQRPNISRSKSLSVCPSVSSFGTEDDIPNSSRQLQAVRRAVKENTKTFASDQLSEASPLLKYRNSSTHLGNRLPSSSAVEDTVYRYSDFEVPSLRRKNPCRSIFGTMSRVMSNDNERPFRGALRGSRNLVEHVSIDEEESQQAARRSLRSCSISDEAPRNGLSLKDQGSQRKVGAKYYEAESQDHDVEGEECIGDGPEDDILSIKGKDQVKPLDFNHENSSMRKLSAKAFQRVRNSEQGRKRWREDSEEKEQPTCFHDEDEIGEDDLVEIHEDIFRASENRREKRHKTHLQDTNKNQGRKSPTPKREQTEENEDIFVEAQVLETGEANTTETTTQERPLCNYYMNTYWEHGRASDGRRARDGFTSYLDFKEYCKKNKQPIDDRCMLTYKKDLKHHLLCEHHATLRQDLFRVAWNFEHNPGFSFKSSNKDEETRRLQNEAIGNTPTPSPGSSASRGGGGAAAGTAVVEAEMVDMIGEILKGIGTSHAADVAQLAKSKKKLENEVKGLKRRLARIRKR